MHFDRIHLGPLVNSEFYPGWLVVWGQKHQALPSIDQIIDTSDYMYQLGANFNFYMFYGGTNFGYWNGAEVTAPVSQNFVEYNLKLFRNQIWFWKLDAHQP